MAEDAVEVHRHRLRARRVGLGGVIFGGRVVVVTGVDVRDALLCLRHRMPRPMQRRSSDPAEHEGGEED